MPNPDREKTLEGGVFTLNVKPEMFEIGIDDHEDEKTKPEEAEVKVEGKDSSSTELEGPQPVAPSASLRLQSSNIGSGARAHSLPSRSRSDPVGFCTLFKQNTKTNKNEQQR